MEEQMISHFGAITLTNLRIRQRYTNQIKSALLGKVDGVAVQYRHYQIWLFFALLAGLGGFVAFLQEEELAPLIVGVFFTVIFVGIYFATRKVVFIVYAGSMEIVEMLKGIPMASAVEFVEAVEQSCDLQRISWQESSKSMALPAATATDE